MRDFLRNNILILFLVGCFGFYAKRRKLSTHKLTLFVSQNEIRTGRAGYVSLLNKRNRSKSKDKCALAWANIVLEKFDTKSLVSTWFY